MNTCLSNGFTGLPPELVREFLASADGIADELAAPLKSLLNDREKLRTLLSERSLMISGNSLNDTASSGKTVCGIDLFSGRVHSSGSGIIASAAFAVEGLLPETGQSHWSSPRHSVVLRVEKPEDSTRPLLHAIACELACELALSAPHEFIFHTMSTIHLFQSVMESLVPAMNAKQSPTGTEFLKRLKGSLTAFGKMFMAGNGNGQHVGFLKHSPKKELSEALGLSLPIEDTMIMTALLGPGEATSPIPIASDELDKTAKLPIRDEQFSAIRDRIVNAISSSSVIYFRPHAWTPAFRIEVPGQAAAGSAMTASLLQAVSQQCSFPGSREPYPLKRAEDLAGSLSGAMTEIRNHASSTVLKHISDIHGSEELASFVLDYGITMEHSKTSTEKMAH